MIQTPGVQTLGDVHLERRFRTGVPLHRIGHREKMVWDQFEHEVTDTLADLHVQVGDLFNEFSVSEATVLRAADIYKRASKKNPDTVYVLFRGNHDASRDTDKKSSFDVFQELMEGVHNVHVLTDPTLMMVEKKMYGFIPWHPFKSSTELATELIEKMRPGEELAAAFCHCDVKSYGGTDNNLIPINVLKHRTKLVYTGHIHLPHEFVQDEVQVVVVGSMQPYAHGEDPYNQWYQTMSFHAFTQMTTWSMLKDVNVRIIVKSNDEIIPEFDCLSCITKKVDDTTTEEGDDETVELGAFDMTALFKLSLSEHNVGADVGGKILARFLETKHA